jgi:endonuclease G
MEAAMTFNPEDMVHAQQVLASVRENWLQRPGVTAVDLGFKWSHGQMTDELAIRVHVSEKKPFSELSEEELFPKEIEGIPIDVIEATYGVQLVPEGDLQLEGAVDGREQRFDPIPLGVSIGNKHTTAGTLGAKVVDVDTGQEMILSNWHVMVGTADPEPDLPIWQPGRLDRGRDSDTIANLSRHVLGPYDAAVSALNGSRNVETQTLEGAPITDVTEPMLGMFIWKSGRTTGRTEGFIDGVQMSLSIQYSVGVRPLQNVFRVVPRPGAGNVEISQGGDSGSIWVDETSGKGVGLHFAGEVGDGPEQALAHDLPQVLQYLNVQLPLQNVPSLPPPDEEPVEDPLIVEEPKSFWQSIWDWLRSLFQ